MSSDDIGPTGDRTEAAVGEPGAQLHAGGQLRAVDEDGVVGVDPPDGVSGCRAPIRVVLADGPSTAVEVGRDVPLGEDLLADLSERLDCPPGGTSADGRYSLEFAECLGACEGAPCMLVDDECHMNLTADEAIKTLKT